MATATPHPPPKVPEVEDVPAGDDDVTMESATIESEDLIDHDEKSDLSGIETNQNEDAVEETHDENDDDDADVDTSGSFSRIATPGLDDGDHESSQLGDKAEDPVDEPATRKTKKVVVLPPTPVFPTSKTQLMANMAEARERMRHAGADAREHPHDVLLQELAWVELDQYKVLMEEAVRRGYVKRPASLAVVEEASQSRGKQVSGPAKIDCKLIPQWLPTWSSTKDVKVHVTRMRAARDRWTKGGQLELTVPEAKEVWTESLKQLGGRAQTLADILTTATSWDEMETFFCEWFMEAEPNPPFDLLAVTWEKGTSASRFCQIFKAAVVVTELPVTHKAVRKLLVQLFLVHFQDSWLFGSTSTFTKKRTFGELNAPAKEPRVTKESGLCFLCHEPGHRGQDYPKQGQSQVLKKPRIGPQSATSTNTTKLRGAHFLTKNLLVVNWITRLRCREVCRSRVPTQSVGSRRYQDVRAMCRERLLSWMTSVLTELWNNSLRRLR